MWKATQIEIQVIDLATGRVLSTHPTQKAAAAAMETTQPIVSLSCTLAEKGIAFRRAAK